jgi:hypothetical protein
MFKKIITTSLMVASLVFAQQSAFVNETVDKNVVETNAVSNSTVSDDNQFAVAIHPLSLVIMTAIGLPTLYITFEAGVMQHASLITRPLIMGGEFESGNEKISILGFGLTEGFRYYLGSRGHRGFYIEGQLQFEYLSLDYKDSGERDYYGRVESASASAMLIAPNVVFGYKVMGERAMFGVDVGIGYNIVSASGRDSASDDIEEVSSTGFGPAFNLYFGFAF